MTLTTLLFISTWVAMLVLALAISGLLRKLHALEAAFGLNYGRLHLADRATLSVRSLERLGITPNLRKGFVLFATGTCLTCIDVVPAFHAYARANPNYDWRIVLADDVPGFHTGDGAMIVVDSGLIHALNIELFPVLFGVYADGVAEVRRVGSIGALDEAINQLGGGVEASIEVGHGRTQTGS